MATELVQLICSTVGTKTGKGLTVTQKAFEVTVPEQEDTLAR
jgi:hypothetical protein